MTAEELKEEYKKEALRKKNIYWKNKSDEQKRVYEKKIHKKSLNSGRKQDLNKLNQMLFTRDLKKRKNSESIEQLIVLIKKLKLND